MASPRPQQALRGGLGSASALNRLRGRPVEADRAGSAGRRRAVGRLDFLMMGILTGVRGPNPSKVLQQLLVLQPEQQLNVYKALKTHLIEKGILQPTLKHAWVLGTYLLVPVEPTGHSPGKKRDLPGNPVPD
ncbi:hypothetical protein J1605_022724 [Eschrichtius robustus]|uniref:Uncharacterized protein n=1 Tax=Eschrichtius robustus TaxID=9764 RepID=A0AB34H8N6_ESCRO|nr:hypothetical protein J1605_022724 [Eschrichtius robustus]